MHDIEKPETVVEKSVCNNEGLKQIMKEVRRKNKTISRGKLGDLKKKFARSRFRACMALLKKRR